MSATDDRRSVLVLLQAAGVAPTPDEVDRMVVAYPGVRRAVQSLYGVTEARYESPAITFDPRIVS